MRFFKVTLPLMLAFVMAVVAMASQFIPHYLSRTFINETTVWFRVIGAITMFIGAYSLLRVHFNKIKRQQKGWGYSVVLYVFFATVLTVGLLNIGPVRDEKGNPVKDASGREVIGAAGPLQSQTKWEHDPGKWLYNSIQRPASSTQYSLLGFFICSAAFRTFRAKTPEAAVLLVASLVVMLGQVPLAALIWDKIPVASQWLLDVPNMAVKRAIMFGICVGSVGTSLRVMFGIERSYMGSD